MIRADLSDAWAGRSPGSLDSSPLSSPLSFPARSAEGWGCPESYALLPTVPPAFPTLLPTVLPGIPHAPPHCPPHAAPPGLDCWLFSGHRCSVSVGISMIVDEKGGGECAAWTVSGRCVFSNVCKISPTFLHSIFSLKRSRLAPLFFTPRRKFLCKYGVWWVKVGESSEQGGR